MFGMGFMEIFLIAIIAIIALGPDKLPTAMVEVAKFLKKFKSGVADAKSTLDNELNITEMKEEANKFKAQLSDTKMSMTSSSKVDLGLDDIMNDELKEEKPKIKKDKKKKAEKTEKAEKIEEATKVEENPANKFKVNFDDEKKEDKA
ncbi:Sec-independent protein translocase protein TatB [Poseidonibacter ostreae]|jgi:sec-independent protein translocase protein TatB|uniref:Sec-independent protein translocase protein TatB homolog n=1 Tax=Poseidonibacter ostreae TaxID=2654171 RepID=A0A6L4WW11_9BACT|nr:Sec-independent protein translocase protein TatB [Poseidonibacter ostreae]KAB7887334.1 Sec-independent protein translocase subunit TatB [Poseidonibacter ostreae]KAB7890241.1 Sec-independent protein translocase subunit TatB [Poseidonibacter ostreae]KAB7890821.1 Sec-independent protein translocase subunit TatB [Poseidonibacter ostreae]MAC84168.1 twin-arginine translocase subunit TatB [Arcobacter sp.]|tara:strand:- start:4258 stop:4698 length:441 start_codon:yes stop_codon:yes gene_type:complete